MSYLDPDNWFEEPEPACCDECGAELPAEPVATTYQESLLDEPDDQGNMIAGVITLRQFTCTACDEDTFVAEF